VDSKYRFRGWRKYTDQALEWPRTGYETDGRSELIWPPTRLEHAVCELALRALTDALVTDTSTNQVVEETVGPITVRYAGKFGQTRYQVVDNLLRPYVIGGAGSLRVERAS
jgi:hypothetical protein